MASDMLPFTTDELREALRKAEQKHGRKDMSLDVLENLMEKVQARLPDDSRSPCGEHLRFALNECKLYDRRGETPGKRKAYSSAVGFAFTARSAMKRATTGRSRSTRRAKKLPEVPPVQTVEEKNGQFALVI